MARATYAIGRRAASRKLLRTPLSPVVHEGVLYVLGRAAQEKQVELHHAVTMPNHGHWTVPPALPDLPELTALFFRESSKFIKNALIEHGFEAPERIWNGERPHVMRLVDAEAQMLFMHYQDVNPVEAGLVARVEDYPGSCKGPALMARGVLTAAC